MSSAYTLQAWVSKNPNNVLELTQSCLEANSVTSNLILPILQKCARQSQGADMPDHLWIVLYTIQNSGKTMIQFIASCTNGYMGKYPLFLFSPRSFEQLVDDNTHNRITPAMHLLVQNLRTAHVPTARIYSVFGPEILATTFSNIWSQITGVAYLQEPYYHAKIGYATAESVERCDVELPLYPNEEIRIRRAKPEDCDSIAELTYGFAAESPPFTLTKAQALREAQILIERREVWLYQVRRQDQPTGWIASIVAFSRNTDTMATITKVYTHPNFRGQRRAERLVREVCRYLLTSKTHIALFVGIDNKAANVYRRVGFEGLASQDTLPLDRWIEIGFDPAQVQLGHW